ncbi:MAG: hypothetical protein K0M56_02295 [Kaistella sp.]|nr:hypothetical protein [Kaistella sp.]
MNTHKKLLTYITNRIIFALSCAFSVIQVNAQILFEHVIKDIKSDATMTVEFKIENRTQKRYAIPIDTTGFKIFNNEERGNSLTYIGQEKGLGFIVVIKKGLDTLDAGQQSTYIGNLAENDDLKKKVDSVTASERKLLDNWQSKYRINDDLYARKNKYLFSSFIFLEPGQIVKYEKSFNPVSFNSQTFEGYTMFNNFLPEQNKQYDLSFFFCLNVRIYDVLTSLQKDQLKNYHLFSGQLQSTPSAFIFRQY